jgi:hypothetical protein
MILWTTSPVERLVGVVLAREALDGKRQFTVIEPMDHAWFDQGQSGAPVRHPGLC